MASSGEERGVVLDLRSAAVSAGGEDARDTPLHVVESLCMRCGENVRASPPPFASVSVLLFGRIVVVKISSRLADVCEL